MCRSVNFSGKARRQRRSDAHRRLRLCGRICRRLPRPARRHPSLGQHSGCHGLHRLRNSVPRPCPLLGHRLPHTALRPTDRREPLFPRISTVAGIVQLAATPVRAAHAPMPDTERDHPATQHCVLPGRDARNGQPYPPGPAQGRKTLKFFKRFLRFSCFLCRRNELYLRRHAQRHQFLPR